jgi:TrmH family RNA methyltransferase
MHITSLNNERIKYLVRLREDRRQRKHDRLMLVEGWDEIHLAIAAGYVPNIVIDCPALTASPLKIDAAETLSVAAPVFQKISYRDNPDGWLAVFPTPHRSLDELQLGERPLVIVAESVEKPGNLGAILRTADAAGVDALLICDPHTDLYGPNVVRASRGTLFSVPVAQGSNQDVLDFLNRHRIRILAATPSAEHTYTAEDLRGPIAIVVGTEDQGLTDFWLGRANAKVLIPMLGKVNSLNVSIAAALIVYEALRQRQE